MNTSITLNNGVEIPSIGLGVYQSLAGSETVNAIHWALEAGYRHIDTAKIYRNEDSVGKAIRSASVRRQEIFVTTKLWNSDHGFDNALRAIDESLAKLQLDYVDLYLVHFPVFGPRLETWKAMERILEEKKARAIGVSNYMPLHMKELLAHCNVPPAVNQIELSPYIYEHRAETLKICRQENILLQAYSPLTKARKLADPKLVVIAEKYKKTSAQVLIRWALQEGFIVLPKSTNKERIAQNIDVFDFEISGEDMTTLNGFNEKLVTGWDPTDAP